MRILPLDSWMHRRGFFGRVAMGTAVLAGARAAVPATLEAQWIEAPAGADDWLARITGAHRQYFDAVSVNDGFPLGYAMNFMNTIGETYKVADKDITAVIGLRHFSIPLAFNNDVWAKYKLGEFLKVNDAATKAPAVRNPYAFAKEGELLFPGMALEKLQARGALVTVCNVALNVLSGFAAAAAGLPKESARQEWLAGMFPGVLVVPSGVLAVNRAQKKGCTYCYAG